MKKNETVVLIHGFNKNGSDMITLKNNLEELGYNTVILNLPTRFRTLEECTSKLEGDFRELIKDIGDIGKIHFVGHSMGGLIIRHFLANNLIANLGRCVLIAAPNKGSKLADMVQDFCSPLLKVFKPIKALTSKEASYLPPLNTVPAEIGLIAGNKSNLLLGGLLPSENDGRVEVESVKLEGMKDFRILNYGHKEIHNELEVAKLIDDFLQRGRF